MEGVSDASGAEAPPRDPADDRLPPSLADAIGGPLGAAESALPAAAFVAVYTAAGQDVRTAGIAAVGLALVLALARIVRGQTVQYALSGLIGVAFAAFVAERTGRAEDFFLPGLLANLAYGSAFLVSIAIRRPLVGYLATALGGGGAARPDTEGADGTGEPAAPARPAAGAMNAWRSDPVFMRAAIRASWLWAALFFLRLSVQLPLYLTDSLVALGTARIAMGIPLFALGVWLSWLLMRPVLHPARAPAPNGAVRT
jgi:hypothetical protein